ncbi:MAG: ester cyclase [Spirochaetes bacterium]|nr:ester cyclase [Spirochaetota bacterium]
MSNENKALIRRYAEECIGKGDLSLFDELLAPNYAMHMNAANFDLEGYKQFQPSVLGAFPDGRWVIEDMVAEGDRVAWRYSFYGTHLGEFMGLPATGKQLRVSGILISRIAHGRIAEEWEIFDAATMFRELGQK